MLLWCPYKSNSTKVWTGSPLQHQNYYLDLLLWYWYSLVMMSISPVSTNIFPKSETTRDVNKSADNVRAQMCKYENMQGVPFRMPLKPKNQNQIWLLLLSLSKKRPKMIISRYRLIRFRSRGVPATGALWLQHSAAFRKSLFWDTLYYPNMNIETSNSIRCICICMLKFLAALRGGWCSC